MPRGGVRGAVVGLPPGESKAASHASIAERTAGMSALNGIFKRYIWNCID